MHARLLLCHVEVLQHIAVVWNVSQLHGAIHAAAAQSVLFFFHTAATPSLHHCHAVIWNHMPVNKHLVVHDGTWAQL